VIPVEVMERFGANLKRARKRRGVSQVELAFAANLNRTLVSLIERGMRFPRIDTLLKLSGALETKVGDLLRGIVWVPADGRRPGGLQVVDDEEPSTAGEDSGVPR
jgi:transcriptional regulator with XRE-family HTH domain